MKMIQYIHRTKCETLINFDPNHVLDDGILLLTCHFFLCIDAKDLRRPST